MTDDARRSAINLALTLVPFAGIAFLWFIAVIRTILRPRTASRDRSFLGSGLIFVAAMFTAAAALKAVLLLDASAAPPTPDIASLRGRSPAPPSACSARRWRPYSPSPPRVPE